MTYQECQSDFQKPTAFTVVGVAFPAAIPGVYDYHIPSNLRCEVVQGAPVLVEVKRRKTWGVAVELKKKSRYPHLKEVLEVKSGQWTDSNQTLMALYEWMASYYQCDLGRVFRPMISKSLFKVKEKTVNVYSVTDKSMEGLIRRHVEFLEKMRECGCALSLKEIEHRFSLSYSTVKLLVTKGNIKAEKIPVIRQADELGLALQDKDITLTQSQAEAVSRIEESFTGPEKPFLIHGITGSGKTHIYVELTRKMLKCGRGVIILVPEISLTPQTIQCFKTAIGDTITVIHSNMSDGERRDSIQEIVTGTKRVVIGVRSAVLIPMENVGLIIVDEEHDGSYKQSDMEPRYNARDVAVMRGHIQKSVVALGSATPSMESYQNALCGKYELITLTQRFGSSRLPEVKIIDMGEERKANNWTPFSQYLQEKILEVVSLKQQVILLLNRRGFSAVLMCKSCSFTYTCPNCSVNLKYHRVDTLLKCHLCGYHQQAPDVCPKCAGENVKYVGTGIQKVEELLHEHFPGTRIIRMDQDTTRRKGAHVSILETFARGEADILLGTQMVSKGLNFPKVTLVGVLQADTGLHFPDFRASERTFQLLTQVAGRAGRSTTPGEVVVQTYFPEEVAITTAQKHDYITFFNGEIETRKVLKYPPHGKLARVVFEGASEQYVRNTSFQIAGEINRKNIDGIVILGPSPAVLSKIDNVYRYSMLLKSDSVVKLSNVLKLIRSYGSRLQSNSRCIIDVDPTNML
ncbi:primosome assembly protein PriA [Chitinispirillum alkaliphilum]|nr:primosome assembly protein PriA [Chitinispirillum alkaliphilum]